MPQQLTEINLQEEFHYQIFLGYANAPKYVCTLQDAHSISESNYSFTIFISISLEI